MNLYQRVDIPMVIAPKRELLQTPVMTLRAGPISEFVAHGNGLCISANRGVDAYIDEDDVDVDINEGRHPWIHDEESGYIDYPPGDIKVKSDATYVEFTVLMDENDLDNTAVEEWYEDYYEEEMRKKTGDFWSCAIQTLYADCEEGKCTATMRCWSELPYDAEKLAKTINYAFDVTP